MVTYYVVYTVTTKRCVSPVFHTWEEAERLRLALGEAQYDVATAVFDSDPESPGWLKFRGSDLTGLTFIGQPPLLKDPAAKFLKKQEKKR